MFYADLKTNQTLRLELWHHKLANKPTQYPPPFPPPFPPPPHTHTPKGKKRKKRRKYEVSNKKRTKINL